MTVLLAATLFDAMSIYWALLDDAPQERRFRELARELRGTRDPERLEAVVDYFTTQGTTVAVPEL